MHSACTSGSMSDFSTSRSEGLICEGAFMATHAS